MDEITKFLINEVLSYIATAGAGMLVIYGIRFLRRYRLKEPINVAYDKLKRVCEPKTLNPAAPGNPDFMKSDARDFVNPLIRKLEKSGIYCPDKCTTDDASLSTWFFFLEKLRMTL